MAKEVISANRFVDPRQFHLGPTRELLVLTCDDGSIYEFQKMDDDRTWELRSRGSRSNDPTDWTQSRAPLPSDVTETLDGWVGEKGWVK